MDDDCECDVCECGDDVMNAALLNAFSDLVMMRMICSSVVNDEIS